MSNTKSEPRYFRIRLSEGMPDTEQPKSMQLNTVSIWIFYNTTYKDLENSIHQARNQGRGK